MRVLYLFLIICSVLDPPIFLDICDHFLPSLRNNLATCKSSSSVHYPLNNPINTASCWGPNDSTIFIYIAFLFWNISAPIFRRVFWQIHSIYWYGQEINLISTIFTPQYSWGSLLLKETMAVFLMDRHRVSLTHIILWLAAWSRRLHSILISVGRSEWTDFYEFLDFSWGNQTYRDYKPFKSLQLVFQPTFSFVFRPPLISLLAEPYMALKRAYAPLKRRGV